MSSSSSYERKRLRGESRSTDPVAPRQPVKTPAASSNWSGDKVGETGWRVRSNKKKNKSKTIAQRTSGFAGAAGDGKYVDYIQHLYNHTTVGEVHHLDIIPRGTVVNSREGRAFRLTSIQMRGMVTSNQDTIFAQAVTYLVWDKQPNKALAAAADIVTPVADSSFTNRENAARFVILRRMAWIVTGELDTGTTAINKAHEVNEYIKLPPDCIASCTVDDATGEIANRISGALLILTIGSTNNAVLDAQSLLTFRLNFIDV